MKEAFFLRTSGFKRKEKTSPYIPSTLAGEHLSAWGERKVEVCHFKV
jgi:hypothetical protein